MADAFNRQNTYGALTPSTPAWKIPPRKAINEASHERSETDVLASPRIAEGEAPTPDEFRTVAHVENPSEVLPVEHTPQLENTKHLGHSFSVGENYALSTAADPANFEFLPGNDVRTNAPIQMAKPSQTKSRKRFILPQPHHHTVNSSSSGKAPNEGLPAEEDHSPLGFLKLGSENITSSEAESKSRVEFLQGEKLDLVDHFKEGFALGGIITALWHWNSIRGKELDRELIPGQVLTGMIDGHNVRAKYVQPEDGREGIHFFSQQKPILNQKRTASGRLELHRAKKPGLLGKFFGGYEKIGTVKEFDGILNPKLFKIYFAPDQNGIITTVEAANGKGQARLNIIREQDGHVFENVSYKAKPIGTETMLRPNGEAQSVRATIGETFSDKYAPKANGSALQQHLYRTNQNKLKKQIIADLKMDAGKASGFFSPEAGWSRQQRFFKLLDFGNITAERGISKKYGFTVDDLERLILEEGFFDERLIEHNLSKVAKQASLDKKLYTKPLKDLVSLDFAQVVALPKKDTLSKLLRYLPPMHTLIRNGTIAGALAAFFGMWVKSSSAGLSIPFTQQAMNGAGRAANGMFNRGGSGESESTPPNNPPPPPNNFGIDPGMIIKS